MLTPSQLKLYELLKTDEQVRYLMYGKYYNSFFEFYYKEDYTKVIVMEYKGRYLCNESNRNDFIEGEKYDSDYEDCDIKKRDKKIKDYIIRDDDLTITIKGCHFIKQPLPLSEHFIRLYCENKNIDCNFNRKDLYVCSTEFVGKEFWIRLDNTKDFNSQSDECYNSICEALINLT